MNPENNFEPPQKEEEIFDYEEYLKETSPTLERLEEKNSVVIEKNPKGNLSHSPTMMLGVIVATIILFPYISPFLASAYVAATGGWKWLLPVAIALAVWIIGGIISLLLSHLLVALKKVHVLIVVVVATIILTATTLYAVPHYYDDSLGDNTTSEESYYAGTEDGYEKGYQQAIEDTMRSDTNVGLYMERKIAEKVFDEILDTYSNEGMTGDFPIDVITKSADYNNEKIAECEKFFNEDVANPPGYDRYDYDSRTE